MITGRIVAFLFAYTFPATSVVVTTFAARKMYGTIKWMARRRRY